MRTSLEKLWHFHILKLLYPSIFLLVLQILCLRCQITSAYIIQSMKFPFITYIWYGAINDNIPTNTNTDKMYVYASERSERAKKILAFLH